MIKRLFLLLLCAQTYALRAEVVVISGVYQGKDLYVKNPTITDGAGFCVFEVLVNGNVTSDEVNSPAFAVDLKAWNLKLGDPVEIVLRCKEDCQVKIINPEVIYPNATFEIKSINLDNMGLITWSAINESAKIAYNIEQFKWNKWVKVGEVMGEGTPELHDYQFQASLTSGSNVFRIMQIDHKGAHFSKELRVDSATPDIRLKSNKISRAIEFTAPTDYEVYSEFGAVVAHGHGSEIDASNFFKGKYYVNFDNKVGIEIDKK
jgi:hypothetical protein